jgi:hypothetical protein
MDRFELVVFVLQCSCLLAGIVFVVTGPELAVGLSVGLAGVLHLLSSARRMILDDRGTDRRSRRFCAADR